MQKVFEKQEANDAVLEIELLDSQTGEQLAVLIDKQSLSNPSQKKKKQKTSWKDIQEIFTFYATRFKARLDATHEK